MKTVVSSSCRHHLPAYQHAAVFVKQEGVSAEVVHE
jgi:hypothetical protein